MIERIVLTTIGISSIVYLGYLAFNGIKDKSELESLKECIIGVIKKLKPQENIIIHYGDDKQLTFIKGKLQ